MISRVRIRNLGPLVDLQSPELGRYNVVVGANEAGKSTLANALALLFTGTARGHETGLGLEDLRTTGQAASKKWGIEAACTFDGKPETLSRTEGEGPKSQRQQLVETITRVPGARARACLEAGEFVRLDGKARQRLLLDLAPRSMVMLPPPHKKAIGDLLGEQHTEIDLPTLERLYKLAYEARTEASRIIKAAGELAPPVTPDGFEDVTDWPAEIAVIRADIKELRTSREAALARAATTTVDLKPYRDAIAKTERELAAAQESIGLLPSRMTIERRGQELVKEMGEAGALNADIEATRRRLTDELGIAQGNAKRGKAVLALLNDPVMDGKCPTCNCKLTATQRKKVLIDTNNQYESAEREAQKIQLDLAKVSEPVSVQTLARESQQLLAKETELARLLGEEHRLMNQRDVDRAALEGAEGMAETPGDPAAAKEAADLGNRLVQGEALLELVVAHVAALEQHQNASTGKAAAETRHAALDQLVNDLGPTGIRKGCGNAGMIQFHDDLNALLAPRGFKVDLRPAMDVEGDPLVTTKGRTIPLGQLSHGALLAFGAAFACAVASYTKLGIVVVDGFEALDPAANEAVQEILDASGHQVFILSVDRMQETETVAAEVNAEGGDMRMFLLREGQLVAPGVREVAA